MYKFDSEKPFAFLDYLSNKVTNPYIMNRITALLNANLILGLLWSFILALILFFFTMTIAMSFISFVIAMILLYFITMMFPIFLVFILFNYTKTYFQQWIDAVLGYSMQIILTFVSLAFMAEIIQAQMQKILGFRMCVAATYHFNPFSDVSGSDVDNHPLTIAQWAPGEKDWYSPITFWGIVVPGYNMYELFVKVHYKFDYSVEKFLAPPEYKEYRYRYKSLPFLEPDENYDIANGKPSGYDRCSNRKTAENCHPDVVFPDGVGQEEHDRIAKMMFPSENNSYEFVSFIDLLGLVILIFISWRINIDVIPSLSYTMAIVQKDYIPPEMFGMTSMQNFYRSSIEVLGKMSDSKNTVVQWMGRIPMMIINPDVGFSEMITFRKQITGSGAYNNVMKKLHLDNLTERIFGQKISGMSDFLKLTPAEKDALFYNPDGSLRMKSQDIFIDKDGNHLIKLNDATIFRDADGNQLIKAIDPNDPNKFTYKRMNDGIEINQANVKEFKMTDAYADLNGRIIYNKETSTETGKTESRKNGIIDNYDSKIELLEAGKAYKDEWWAQDMLKKDAADIHGTADENRFARAGHQVFDAIKDSMGLLSDKARAKDEAIDVENLRVLHKWQDEIGGRIDWLESKWDKFGSSAFGKAMDPTHSLSGDLFGTTSFNPFREDKPESEYEWRENPFKKAAESFSNSFERHEGFIEKAANALAGDAINKWAQKNHYVKDDELVFKHEETVGGALGKFFHEDEKSIFTPKYNKIADMDYDAYMKAINTGWENRLDNRNSDNKEKKDDNPYKNDDSNKKNNRPDLTQPNANQNQNKKIDKKKKKNGSDDDDD